MMRKGTRVSNKHKVSTGVGCLPKPYRIFCRRVHVIDNDPHQISHLFNIQEFLCPHSRIMAAKLNINPGPPFKNWPDLSDVKR
jgi:hypothetical protein